ncbi:hypothetical protein RchiOBHm_Chr1g0383141 [Rosa chinensis]|uniref:Uncharacterized protein n=1 Tax=Rosa chinensis TaxID=74649 RepID=A0A2P6SPK4_ROSCH|nr:hypothetical protein RchiOBHm_Chr1g0383141 [Rosa chinensis]
MDIISRWKEISQLNQILRRSGKQLNFIKWLLVFWGLDSSSDFLGAKVKGYKESLFIILCFSHYSRRKRHSYF